MLFLKFWAVACLVFLSFNSWVEATPRPASLWGKVIDSKGQPISNVSIEVRPQNGQIEQTLWLRSDESGYFSTQLKEKRVDLLILRHSDYATSSKTYIRSNSKPRRRPIKFILKKAPSCTLKVKGAQGQALSGGRLYLGQLYDKGAWPRLIWDYASAEIDSQGFVQVPQLPQGRYYLQLHSEDHHIPQFTTIDHRGSDKPIEVEAYSGLPFRLSFVSPTGQAVSGVSFRYSVLQDKIQSFDDMRIAKSLQAYSDSEGQAHLILPRKGYLNLELYGTIYNWKRELNVPLEAQRSLELVVEIAQRCRGKVVLGGSGEALHGAHLAFEMYDREGSEVPLTYNTKTNAKGEFDFGLGYRRLGAYVTVVHLEHPPLYLSLEGLDLQNLNISMSQGPQCVYRLLQKIPNSEPALITGPEEIKIYPQGGLGTGQIHKIFSDEQGRFRMGCLKTGERFRFKAPGMKEHIVIHDSSLTQRDLLLDPAARVKFHISDEQGKPLRTVHIYHLEGSRERYRYQSARSLGGGWHLVENLPTGLRKFRVQSDRNYLTLELEKELRLGQTVEAKISLLHAQFLPLAFKNLDSVPERVRVNFYSGKMFKRYRVLKFQLDGSSPHLDIPLQNPPQADRISFRLNGYQPVQLAIPRSFQEKVWITLEKGNSRSFKIVDAHGKGIANALLRLEGSQQFWTNDSGEGEMGNLTARERGEIRAEGYAPQDIVFDLANPNPLHWVLHRGASANILCLDTLAEPVQGVEIKIQRWRNERFESTLRPREQPVNSDFHGRASLKNLGSGRYRIVAQRKDVGYYISPPLELNENEHIDLEARLSPSGQLSGQVIDEQGDVPKHVCLQAIPIEVEGHASEHFSCSDSEGRFAFSQLDLGRSYSIVLRKGKKENRFKRLVPVPNYRVPKSDVVLELRNEGI